MRTRRAGRCVGGATAVVLVAASAVAAGPSPASAVAPTVTLLSNTTLDPSALFFVSYDGIVNNGSYQQNGILSWSGHQYAAWYTASRNVVVARRPLSSTSWSTVTLSHRLTVNDSHNSISLGVSPADGRLHIAMDTHNSAIHYVKSEAGLATNPGRTWVASRFGAVQRSLDGLSLGNITYPRFVNTSDNRMQLSYRTGGSGNGTMELAEYSAGGTWSRLGRWSSASGSYSQHGATSTTRNLYLHGLTYGRTGRLHATFTWREGNAAVLCHPGGLANHDTGYVYSDDRGRTWRNNAGSVVATTGSGSLVSVTSPGHVVDPLNVDHALINQESQAVDSAGNVHAIVSYVPGRFTQCVSDFVGQRRSYGRAFHLRRGANGAWTKAEIPVALNAFGRSRLVFDAADNAYVVLPYGRIVAASRASNYTDWAVRHGGLGAFGEVLVDDHRMRTDGVLSVFYQQSSSGTTPSPIRVADFRLNP